MDTFTFDSPKILNTTLRPDAGSPAYTITTFKKGSSRQRTSVEGAPGMPDAVIEWKDGAFTIGDATRDIAELRKKRATFSASRYWTWFDCEEYRVKYESKGEHTWTVFSYSGTVLATFRSNIHRVFHENVLPVLCMLASIRDEEERRFIILVLVYSETKRLESLKEVKTRAFWRDVV
ncbi:hypothetical protein DFH09DRAFT_626127 [Mycena vulgaris]|nr:hypothetical protein DFH09DRAFT_626127 [Mycena vulgaris]